MTIKASEIIGNKIISLQDGKEIGKIQDLVYDPEMQKIRALIIDKGGWFSEQKLILIDNVKNIGQDAAVVESTNVVRKVSEVDKNVADIAKNDTYVTRTKVLTDSGEELGTVHDILFNPTNGSVEKFEITQGGLMDLGTGKKYIDVSKIETIGQDTIIVKSATSEEFKQQSQTQGIAGVVNEGTQKAKDLFSSIKEDLTQKTEEVKSDVESKNVPEKVDETKEEVKAAVDSGESKIQEVASETKTKTEDFAQNVKDKVGEYTETIKEKVSEERQNISNKNRQDAVGRYLTINVLTPDDEILAKRGDMVTNYLLNQAENFGVLQQILDHTSESPIGL